MVIKYNIPNGRMGIDLDKFLPGAGKNQIRKMLKQLSHSWPNGEQVREIREWLTGRRQDELGRAVDCAKLYVDEDIKWKQLKEQYRQMQSPCYAMYTTDKGKLAEAKENVSRCRAWATRYKREMDVHRKLAERYEGILKDADKLLS